MGLTRQEEAGFSCIGLSIALIYKTIYHLVTLFAAGIIIYQFFK